ncbi:inosine/xanthosine triphosphatase [Pantoea vagans]|uniref:inosine/xanthosine triphosphatase n=1 Tax=Pantoea vagans TaxID=470934 RepID=UPI0030186A6F
MPSNHPTFLLTSVNEAKINSLKNVCSAIFKDFTVTYKSAESGVSQTPDNDDEAINGCHARISDIEASLSAPVDYIIALEGLIERKDFGDFVYGWAMIKDVSTSLFYYGCSGKVMLPAGVVDKIGRESKLSEVIISLYPHISWSDMNRLGTNGVLTKGVYTRVNEFETALRCAFGSLIMHKDLRHD